MRDEEGIGRLQDLATLLSEDHLEDHLGDVARLTAEATGAAACSTMLVEEDDGPIPRLKLWASTEQLPEEAWKSNGGPETIAYKVLEHGQPVLVDDIRRSEFGGLGRNRPQQGASFIAVPVRVGSGTIGVMNLTSHPDAGPFSKGDLSIALIAASLIAKSVQVTRLQTMLRSRVAQLTLAREEKEVAMSLTSGALPPAKLAKMLAKAFYKDLATAGFNPGQIVEAASEIIAQISSDVARYKTRMTRGKKTAE